MSDIGAKNVLNVNIVITAYNSPTKLGEFVQHLHYIVITLLMSLLATTQ